MAKSNAGKRKEVDPSPKEIAKRERDRAHYLRGKAKAGKPLSDDERAWLAAYDARPHGNVKEWPQGAEGAPAATAPPADGVASDPVAPAAGADVESAAKVSPSIPSVESAPALPPTPPIARVLPPRPEGLPTPPRVERGERPATGRKRWQDGYAGFLGAEGGDGREGACVYVAGLWHGALKQIKESLVEAEIEPIIDPDALVPAMVLVVDKILPPEFALTPEVVACGGSSALLVQRLLKRETIKRARDAKELASKRSRPVQLTSVPAEPEPESRRELQPIPPTPERAPVAPPVAPAPVTEPTPILVAPPQLVPAPASAPKGFNPTGLV
jgi:hypothetical protein